MIVLCVTNCPAGLRGDLSKWLNEIDTGVYVGRVNARVREELWKRICDNIKTGRATMVYSANNEQQYAFRTHNTGWYPVDYEGITLMQKPLRQNEDVEHTVPLKNGFSRASRLQQMKSRQGNSKTTDYVVVDVETTGLDCEKDRIIEIGLLKIKDNEITDSFECLIQSGKTVPENIVQLTGITNAMVEEKGLTEGEALEKVQALIGNNILVGYNVTFDLSFLQKLSERVGKNLVIKRTKDVMQLARRKLDDLKNYKMETVASYFSLEIGSRHRALTDCQLTYEIYCQLNKM